MNADPVDPTPRRQTTADGVDTLYSARYRQTYHSTHGALAEAEHVFLKGTGVSRRLWEAHPTRVLEVGFGTGLNFWLTARQSRETAAHLHYTALEKALLPAQLLTQLNHGRVLEQINDIRQSFLAWRAHLPDSDRNSILHWDFEETVCLELILSDATIAPIPDRDYHAIYHDAFSPDANPELWTVDFFRRLYQVLTPGGKLATYSVKGAVRRNLQAVGFDVQKQPGPPGKREMLVAVKPKT